MATRQLIVAIDFHCICFPNIEVNGAHQLFGYPYSSRYILCSAKERKSYSFGTTWGWV